MAKSKNYKDIFPILAIDKDSNAIVSANGDLTIGLEVALPEIFTLSDGDYDNISETLVNSIKALPVGYVFHKQDWYVEEKFAPNLEHNLYSSDLARENELHFNERPYLRHKCYIYITAPAADVEKRTSLKSSLLKRHLVPVKQLDMNRLQSFVETVNKFVYLLASLQKIGIKTLKREDLLGSKNQTGIYQQYGTLSFDDPTINEIETSNDGFLQIGHKNTYTLTISELSDFPTTLTNSVIYQPYSSDKYKLRVSTGSAIGLGLNFNHIVNQIIVIGDKDKLSKKLVAENKRHLSFAQWSSENQASIEYKSAYLGDMSMKGRVPVLGHVNVLVWDEDKNIAMNNRATCLAAIAGMDFVPREAKSDAAAIYWSCIPGNVAEIGKDNLFTAFIDEVTDLLAIETNYKDDSISNAGIRLTDRFGRPVMVDLFFKPRELNQISNRNIFAVGPSGSGKSFFTNNMVYYMLSGGMHVSIVDVGHSYRRLCDLMGGRYITYEMDNPIHFNPFYFKDGNPSEEEMDSIAELLKALWKTEDDRVSTAEMSTITNLVYEYYSALRKKDELTRRGEQNGKRIFPCFNTFYEFTKEDYPKIFENRGGREEVEFDLTNFLYVLRPYYKGGQYDYLLNSRDNIDLMELPFVVYELDNIKDHPVLFPVTTIMIMSNYVRKLVKVKGVLKALIIEEAWKALTKDKFANFLKWAAKTVRKHMGSLAVVTQEVDDLVGSSIVKDALINNSDIKILLDQRNYENRFPEIAELLGLSEKESTIIQGVGRSLDHTRPPYREVAIALRNNIKVYGLETSGAGYAAFTTERSEVENIYLLAEESYGGDKNKAVFAWGRGERPKGSVKAS